MVSFILQSIELFLPWNFSTQGRDRVPSLEDFGERIQEHEDDVVGYDLKHPTSNINHDQCEVPRCCISNLDWNSDQNDTLLEEVRTYARRSPRSIGRIIEYRQQLNNIRHLIKMQKDREDRWHQRMERLRRQEKRRAIEKALNQSEHSTETRSSTDLLLYC